MNINGMTNKVDVINSIIDNIDDAVNMDDDGNLDTAKDSLNQLKEIEENEAEALNPEGKYILRDPLDSETAKQLELPMLELENEMTIGK